MEVGGGVEACELATQFEKTFDLRVRTPSLQELAHVGLVTLDALLLRGLFVLFLLGPGRKLKES